MDELSRDEMLGAVTWIDPRLRGHGVPPPLRIRGPKRPPREVHFDRVGDAACVVTLWEWFAILEPAAAHLGERAKRDAVGWYSRSSSFRLPAWMAAAASRAWRALDEQDLIVMVPQDAPPAPPKEVQHTLPIAAADGGLSA